jgi:hypothetical protein
MARVLCAILCAIGTGSYLFHTHATAWASVADTTPIGIFILSYLFITHRDILGLSLTLSLIGTALFIPYAAVVVPILNRIPFIEISNFYWTVPILLFAYAAFLKGRAPATARGFVAGGLILWPVKLLLPLGFALLFLQGISELIKRIAGLVGAAEINLTYEKPLQ